MAIKTTWVCDLPKGTQGMISRELRKSHESRLEKSSMNPLEKKLLIDEYVSQGLNGKLCDLENTIDINKYL